MNSKLAWLLYVAVGAIHRLFHPYRVVKFGGGFIYLARDSVWYVGPDGEKRKLSASEPAPKVRSGL